MSQRSDTDEIQLLNELREGKHTAFALIYERHWKKHVIDRMESH